MKRIHREVLIEFWELASFTSAWSALGLSDDDLAELQSLISKAPTGSPAIPGTNGLRKIRFSSDTRSGGKRSGFRACYAYFQEVQVVLLVAVYAKNEQGDLSASHKKSIAEYLKRAKHQFLKLLKKSADD